MSLKNTPVSPITTGSQFTYPTYLSGVFCWDRDIDISHILHSHHNNSTIWHFTEFYNDQNRLSITNNRCQEFTNSLTSTSDFQLSHVQNFMSYTVPLITNRSHTI